jgi:threonine/homoserine/homoserine lactone efflux protein
MKLFTSFAQIAAVLAILLGIMHITVGFGVLTGAIVEPHASALLGSKTSGEWINLGFYRIFIGLLLGTITDISRSVAKSNKPKPEPANGS